MADLHAPFEPTLEDLQREHKGAPRGRHSIPKDEATEARPFRNYVRDLVLGFNDGLVSTYAATAGVTGAVLAATGGAQGVSVAVVGIAAGLAGALSMGVGEYVSTKSQTEYYASERRREKEHIKNWPHLEALEVREALAKKGLTGDGLESAIKSITDNPETLLEFMMREEFGVGEEAERRPRLAAGLIFLAFLGGAIIPVAPYLFLEPRAGLTWSSAASLAGLFGTGAWRAWLSDLKFWKLGLEMVMLGAFAAAVTFLVGRWVGAAL